MPTSTSHSSPSGSLLLVATPLGNLEDISLRALAVLRGVALVAAEDTRHTRKLLSAHGISQELISYREHNHRQAAARVFAKLEAGHDVALVSDAGTPGISDPGQALVVEAIDRGVPVVPVPGPCAGLAALAASGLPTDRFVFIGFLPRKPAALRRAIEQLRHEPGSLVFYESPRRVGQTLAILAEVFGPRPAVLARELTKIHETFDRSGLVDLAARYAQGTRGEVTLVVAGAPPDAQPVRADGLEPLVAVLRAGQALSASQVARLLAPLTDLDRRELYRLASQGSQEAPDE